MALTAYVKLNDVQVDFIYLEHGSLILLFPKTDEAKNWSIQNILLDQWQDKDRILIDAKRFEGLLTTIEDKGFNVVKSHSI